MSLPGAVGRRTALGLERPAPLEAFDLDGRAVHEDPEVGGLEIPDGLAGRVRRVHRELDEVDGHVLLDRRLLGEDRRRQKPPEHEGPHAERGYFASSA